MTKKKQILDIMQTAEFAHMNFAVKIVNIDANTEEIIVIPHNSIREKIKYYENAYNENMELKKYTSIKIIACVTFSNTNYSHIRSLIDTK